jgi:LPXTG-motif cell wall-anchored protein
MELGSGSLRTLSNAQELLEGIDSGEAPRDGGDPETGDPDTAPSPTDEDRAAEASQIRADRLADTGASGWLFAMVGALMIALVGLALMALPRGRRQH